MKPRSRSDVSCGSPLSSVERQHLMTDARRRSRLELLPTSLANPDVVRSSTPFAGVLARVDRQCDIGAGRKRLNLGGRRCRADDDAFAVPVEPDSRAREAERSSSCASGCSSHSLSYPVWINQASVAVCPWRSRPREPHGNPLQRRTPSSFGRLQSGGVHSIADARYWSAVAFRVGSAASGHRCEYVVRVTMTDECPQRPLHRYHHTRPW